MDINNLSFEDFAGLSFDCECGRKHSLDIGEILYGENVLKQAANIAKEIASDGKIQIVCDQNTYKACANTIEEKFTELNLNYKTYMFKTEHDLVPGNRQIGKMLIETPNDVSLMVAVGSGVINDITRQVSYKMKIPYFVVGTAPSMDGYASVTSSLVIEDRKSTIDGQVPKAIIADKNILKKAPQRMLKAGFGDVMGKITGLVDWNLGVKIKDEHSCPVIISMVNRAVKKCIDSANDILERNENAVSNVFEALIIAGVTMGLYNNTRPASGAEHHLAHFWDLKAIENNEEHPLHGESVGVGTVIICRLYELAKDLLPFDPKCPSPQYIKDILNKAGAKSSPLDIDIKKDVFKESIENAYKLSWKYTILTFLNEKHPEKLKVFAQKITEEIYSQ